MKANAPEKLYLFEGEPILSARSKRVEGTDVEYIRADAFINKARKWFEKQPETYDGNGVRCYSTEDFEDFVKFMKGE